MLKIDEIKFAIYIFCLQKIIYTLGLFLKTGVEMQSKVVEIHKKTVEMQNKTVETHNKVVVMLNKTVVMHKTSFATDSKMVEIKKSRSKYINRW